MSLFEPSMAQMMNTVRGTALRAGFGQFAKILKSWDYIDGEPFEGDWLSRYAVHVQGGTAYLEVRWTPNNKMASFTQLYAELKG